MDHLKLFHRLWANKGRKLADFDRLKRTLASEVEINSAVQTLNFILNEKGDFYVFIFEELEKLLFSQPVVVRGVARSQFVKLLCGIAHALLSRGSFNQAEDHVEVSARDVVGVLSLSGVKHLVFEAH